MKRGMIMKLKRIGSIVPAIVIILLLLVIVLAPVVASGQNNLNGPVNCGPQGSNTYGRCAGKFLVIMCGPSYACYNWVEGWQQGTTLAEPVSQVGTCYASPGTEYKLEIPAGTKITDYYSAGGIPFKAHFIEFKIIAGEFYFSPNLKLSQPATLYKLVDGEWVEVLSFTQVLNGKAS